MTLGEHDESQEHLMTAVDATIAIAEAQLHARDLGAAHRLAIWQLYHEDGLSQPEIERRITAEALSRGMTEAQIAGLVEARLWVSHDTVNRIVGSRKNPKPRPTEVER